MNENIEVLAQNQTKSELDDKYIIFILNKQKYLFPIKNIKEVIKMPEIIPGPNLPDYYLGYFRLRDDIIPVISLKNRLCISSQEKALNETIIIFLNSH